MKPLKFLLVLVLLFTFTEHTKATHLLGGEITWECDSNGKYIFTLKAYVDCGIGSTTITPPFNINGPQGTITCNLLPGYPKDISPDCYLPSNGISCNQVPSGMGAVQEFVAQSAPVTLNGVPPVSGWVFSWSICCRPATLINGGDNENFFLRSVMYPYVPPGQPTPQSTGVCYDNSPVFKESVALSLCKGQPFTYNHLASDRDMDSIYIRWGRPLYTANQEVSWNTGYSYSNPFPNPNTDAANGPVTLQGETGEISMNVQVAPDGPYTSCFAIETWRCGGNSQWYKIAEVYRDVSLIYRDCPSPNAAPLAYIDTITWPRVYRDDQKYFITTYPGDTVRFSLIANDNGQNPPGQPGAVPQKVTFTSEGLMVAHPLNSTTGCVGPAPCASFTPDTSQNGQYTWPANNHIWFEWTPDCQHLNFNSSTCGRSSTFYFSMRMQDDACPAPAISLSTLVISVLPGNTQPVNLHTVSFEPALGSGVDSLRLTWNQPPKDNALSFNYYKIFGAVNYGGPYAAIDSIPSYSQLSATVDASLGYRYFYMIQSTGKCDFISANSDTLKATGIGIAEQQTSTDEIQVFPNPVKDHLNIRLSSAFREKEIEVFLYDLSGRILAHHYAKHEESDLQLDFVYPEGAYLLQLRSGTEVFTYKIIR